MLGSCTVWKSGYCTPFLDGEDGFYTFFFGFENRLQFLNSLPW